MADAGLKGARITEPWLCLGDFNDVTLACEKEGGHAVNHRKMQHFRTLVDKCGFLDLSFNGPRHTWCNKREPQQRVGAVRLCLCK